MNGTNIDAEVATVAELLTRNWWLILLRGIAAVLFGVLAFVWPAITLFALVFLFGAYALATGILSLILAYKAPKGFPRSGALVIGGVLSIIAGLIAFFLPGLTAVGLLILIAAWAILSGIVEIMAAIRLRRVITREWLLVLAGLASIALGVILLLQPAAGALALVWLIGAWAFVFGILFIVLSLRLRRWRSSISLGEMRTA
jgi:uncharacterized membrane protein HdeD (DUF308 family)